MGICVNRNRSVSAHIINQISNIFQCWKGSGFVFVNSVGIGHRFCSNRFKTVNFVSRIRSTTIADKDKLIERLVKNSKALAKYAAHTYLCTWHNTKTMKCLCGYTPILEAHTALLTELEGKGFDAAMKRVLTENAGAWKALGGEEGKG